MKKSALKLIGEYERAKIAEFLAYPNVVDVLAKIKAADADGFTGLVISTEHIDRAGEIVRQDGLDSSLYMKNPVILNSHNYYGIENIVGVTTRLYKGTVDNVPATLADGKWAPTEAGQMAKSLWDAKCLSACSVGFIPEEFDATNPSVITKWQLLEFSVVPVPANAWATRQEAYKTLTEKGITAATLRTKGFEAKDADEVETKTPEVGDECTMEDGGVGVFSDDGSGTLICVPIEQESAKAFWAARKAATQPDPPTEDKPVEEDKCFKALKDEHDVHEKAVKGHVKEYMDCMKSEHGKTPADGATDDEKSAFATTIKAACAEHEKKLKACMKAENDRHTKCVQKAIDEYKAAAGHPANDPEVEPDGDEKSAKILIAIDELKALLKPAEGNDPAEPAPSQRSTPPATSADLSETDLKTVLAEVQTAVQDALTRAKEKRRERHRRS